MKISLILILLVLFTTILTDEELERKIKQEVEVLSTSKPSDSDNYIRYVSSWGEITRSDFSLSEMEEELDFLNIYDNSRDKLKGIIFSATMIFQSFTIEITGFLGQLRNLVGLAKKQGDDISLIFMTSHTVGKPIQQYNSFTEKTCENVYLFFEKCYTNTRNVPRGFNPYELSVIENTLRYHSYETFKSLSLNSVYLQLLEKAETTNLNNINDFNDYSAGIDYLFETNSDQPFMTQIKSKIEQIENGIEIKILEEIPNGYVTTTLKSLKIVPDEQYDMIIDILQFNAEHIKDEYRHNIYRVISSMNEEKNLTFIEVLVHYSEVFNHYEVEVRKLNTDIKLDQEIFLFKYNFQEKYSHLISREEADNDCLELGALFELLTQRKSGKNNATILTSKFSQLNKDKETVYSENFLSSNKELILLAEQQEDGFNKLISSFNKITNVWAHLVSIFKNSRSTEIKEKLIREGFDKFDQTTQVQLLHGLTSEGLNKFSGLLPRRLGVPENKKEDVKNILLESAWMDSNIWANYDLAFSTGDGGKVKYASIFSHQDSNGKFFMVTCEIQSSFELSPDLLIITEKLSVLGGVFSDSKDRLEYRPKSLNAEDIKTIFSFFQLIAIKNVAAHFGIGLELPK
jgi:hypothetical protein